MKMFFIVMGLIIGIPSVYLFTRHNPTQWEIATQIIAHNGDTINPLFEAMREFDSLAFVNDWSPKKDDFMDKHWHAFYANWLKENPSSVYASYQACERWKASAYDFAMNYYATCQGLGYNLIVFADHKIYPIKFSWWIRPLPQAK